MQTLEIELPQHMVDWINPKTLSIAQLKQIAFVLNGDSEVDFTDGECKYYIWVSKTNIADVFDYSISSSRRNDYLNRSGVYFKNAEHVEYIIGILKNK